MAKKPLAQCSKISPKSRAKQKKKPEGTFGQEVRPRIRSSKGLPPSGCPQIKPRGKGKKPGEPKPGGALIEKEKRFQKPVNRVKNKGGGEGKKTPNRNKSRRQDA